MVKRIVALVLILAATSVAWMILSVNMTFRTQDRGSAMGDAVGGLWGTEQHQVAPTVRVYWETVTRTPMNNEEKLAATKKKLEEEQVKAKMEQRPPRRLAMAPADFVKLVTEKHDRVLGLQKSDISVDLALDYRKKGLLWFSTYTVDYKSVYAILNPADQAVSVVMCFPFPSSEAVYDNMAIEAPGINDLTYGAEPVGGGQNGMVARFTLPPNASQLINFRYRSRGLNDWTYRFGENVEMVRNFKLAMQTDFDDMDFPRDSISPDQKERRPGGGWVLTWEKESLVSAVQIGMIMPRRLNPGPLAAAMCTTAPVSLLFFFFTIFTLQVMRNIKLHPMNYFFLAAGFFSFNILFSYLVDHLDIKLSFLISAAVSYFLVVSSLRLVVGTRFALVEAGLSQFLYEILFAFAHFFEGYTGLAVTIGAIISLAVLMRLTAKVDWDDKFRDRDRDKTTRVMPGRSAAPGPAGAPPAAPPLEEA